MRASEKFATEVYASSVKNNRKREADVLVHRNFKKDGDIPQYKKAIAAKKKLERILKAKTLSKLMADQKCVLEWYHYLTGYTAATLLDVISMAYDSWTKISLAQVENFGVLTNIKHKLVQEDT